MNRFAVFLIYNLLLPVVLIIGFPRFLIKGIQRGGLARNFGQRFGVYRRDIRDRLASREGSVWIHAVSVGEVLVALKVIAALGNEAPGKPVVLSTTTTTGFAVAEKEAGENVTVIHNPVDLPFVVGWVIRQIRPERLVLVEAEVWPNLVRKVRARGIPVTLVNARLSERSERRFLRFQALTGPIFRMLTRVCVPFDVDIARWEALGVERARIELTGSVKFDEAASETPEAKIVELREWLKRMEVDPDSARILLAGSTHAGEEALIGRAWLGLREKFPDIVYIVIPRHAERARSAANDLIRAGISPILKVPVKGFENAGSGGEGPRCIVANTTGELRAWYHLAEVVVIGKSLIGRGGQNPVEPLMAGKAVIAGPHMGNFSAIIASLIRERGILQVGSGGEEELGTLLERLFENASESAAIAERGQAVIERHRGAARRTVEWILSDPESG